MQKTVSTYKYPPFPTFEKLKDATLLMKSIFMFYLKQLVLVILCGWKWKIISWGVIADDSVPKRESARLFFTTGPLGDTQFAGIAGECTCWNLPLTQRLHFAFE